MLDRLHIIFEELCDKWEVGLEEFNGEADHIHLLLDMNPNIAPSKLINNLKTVISRLLRKEFSEQLSHYYWTHLGIWTRAYCLLSVGGAPLEILKEYIKNQERPKE